MRRIAAAAVMVSTTSRTGTTMGTMEGLGGSVKETGITNDFLIMCCYAVITPMLSPSDVV